MKMLKKHPRRFIIHGRHKVVSTEEIRCMLHAAATVCELHGGRALFQNTIVWITGNKKKLGKTRVKSEDGKTGKQASGIAHGNGDITLANWQKASSLFTVIIHEVIHQTFPDVGEAETCTLTNRLKPAIAEIHDVLIDRYYERAAYVAHRNISYRPQGEDHYRNHQWDGSGLFSDAGEKYRKKKSCGEVA